MQSVQMACENRSCLSVYHWAVLKHMLRLLLFFRARIFHCTRTSSNSGNNLWDSIRPFYIFPNRSHCNQRKRRGLDRISRFTSNLYKIVSTSYYRHLLWPRFMGGKRCARVLRKFSGISSLPRNQRRRDEELRRPFNGPLVTHIFQEFPPSAGEETSSDRKLREVSLKRYARRC